MRISDWSSDVCSSDLGTFYSYFAGKEDILRELVNDMGHDVRARLAARTLGAHNRIDAEEKGLRAFLEYVTEHPALYRILQEAQFVDESIFRHYYETFADGYERMLANATGKGEIRPGNNALRPWAIMGMSNFMCLRCPFLASETYPEEGLDTNSNHFS